MRRLSVLGCCALILTLGVPIRAEEFQVRIKGGTIDARPSNNLSGAVAVTGLRGLTFAATFDDNGDTSANCAPCEAGQTISLSGWIGGGFSGSATFRGESYQLTANNAGGQIFFESPAFTLPAGATQERHTVEFEAPFTLTTPSSFLTLPGPNDTLGDTLRFSGHGHATATFTVTYDADLQTHFYFLAALQLVFDK